jgi:peptide/nickel transport system substrate-binding protein
MKLIRANAVVLAAGLAWSLAAGSALAQNHDLVIAFHTEPTTIDPCDLEAAGGFAVNENVVQTLTDLDPATSDVIPLLATSWTQDSPNTWTFKLREGVTFSDGSPFNAEAAVWAINRGMNTPEITCSDQAKIAEKLTAEALDATTIRVVTEKPSPSLPREFAFRHMPSPTSTPAKEKTASPVGTGAYAFVEWKPGESITLQRRDDYWGTQPAAEKVTVLFRPEPSVRAQMVQTGEADIAYPVPPQFATTDDRTKEFPVSAMFFVRLSTTIPPLDDIRVRQAIRAAFDKATGVKVLLDRIAVPSDNVVAANVNAYIPDYQDPIGFNLDKAKELIAAAKADGVPVDTKIDFIHQTNQFNGSAEIMGYLAQNLQDLGLNINLVVVDAKAWADILFTRSTPTDRPIILSARNRQPTGDASPTFTSYMDLTGCCAATKDETLAGLIDAARQEADPQKRREAWQKAAMYEYTDDVSVLPIAELKGLMLLSNRIDYEPDGQTDGMQIRLGNVTFK